MGAEDMVAEQVHAELARLRSTLDRAEADRATLAIELERLIAGLEGYSIVYGQNAVMCDTCGAVIAGCGPTGGPSALGGVVLAAVAHSRECGADDPDAEQRAALERDVMSREPI